VRNLAEKTDMGRLASPSLLKLVYDSARPSGKTSEGRLSTEIWNEIEQLLDLDFPDLIYLKHNGFNFLYYLKSC